MYGESDRADLALTKQQELDKGCVAHLRGQLTGEWKARKLKHEGKSDYSAVHDFKSVEDGVEEFAAWIEKRPKR